MAALSLNALAGLLLVEVVIRKWRRIPFTCVYLPGKRPLVHTLLLTFTVYTLFVNVGTALIIAGLRNRTFFLVSAGLLLAAVVGLRRRRRAICARSSLEFDDTLPNDCQVIHL